MTNSQFENIKSDLLPYDFVKENEVIVSESNNEFVAISPIQLSLNLYQEIQRYLNSSFKFELLSFVISISTSPLLNILLPKVQNTIVFIISLMFVYFAFYLIIF